LFFQITNDVQRKCYHDDTRPVSQPLQSHNPSIKFKKISQNLATRWIFQSPERGRSVFLEHSCGYSNHTELLYIIFSGSAAQRGLWPPCSRGFVITHDDPQQLVGLLWMSDQLVTRTSTWQHTIHTTDKHPCPRWDSNSRLQQASGRRPTP
jgi:hypothetical protein